MLPADGHVHSEWSWDAVSGSMEQTCIQAVAVGLPAVAFTEHADYTTWTILDSELEANDHLRAFATAGGITPPELDLGGWCRTGHVGWVNETAVPWRAGGTRNPRSALAGARALRPAEMGGPPPGDLASVPIRQLMRGLRPSFGCYR